MRDEKWQKINELFHAALEINAENRLQFIRDESGNDQEIIAEVSKLVSSHEEAKSFIKIPVANDALKIISDKDGSVNIPENSPPKVIGPYLLLKKLGRGAFGEVWLAEKESSLVTAKFALKFSKDDDIELEAIRKEAELWQKASGHPNILPLIEANIYNGQAVIVSEYVKDGSLEIWLRNNGGKSPSQEKAVEIMGGILDGLEHLHNRRIIHRDLKPANILMQEGKPRLTDFGVSKILKDEGNTTKNISGTVAYMSPEALEGKRNFQSDLWSAAVILYQMLTGQMPFRTPDQVSLMLSIVTKEPFELPPDVKDKWGEFFKIALSKNPALRFQSASQMKQAMEYAWNNLSLEPVTRKYQNLALQTGENAKTEVFDTYQERLRTDDFENKTTLLDSDLKKTQVLRQNTTDSDIENKGKSNRLFAGIGVSVLALILSAGAVWFFFLDKLNKTDFEVVLRDVPSGSDVLVDGSNRGVTGDDGTIRLEGLRAGETKKIEIRNSNFKCEPREVKGNSSEIIHITVNCISTRGNTGETNVTDSTTKSPNQPLQKSDAERIQTNNFKKKITGDKSESKYTFEVGPGETVLKLKITAQVDNAGATIYFKDTNGDEIAPFVLVQGITTEGTTVETVKIKTEKQMPINMEIKELQYGSRATYPGILEIEFSGAFIAAK